MSGRWHHTHLLASQLKGRTCYYFDMSCDGQNSANEREMLIQLAQISTSMKEVGINDGTMEQSSYGIITVQSCSWVSLDPTWRKSWLVNFLREAACYRRTLISVITTDLSVNTTVWQGSFPLLVIRQYFASPCSGHCHLQSSHFH